MKLNNATTPNKSSVTPARRPRAATRHSRHWLALALTVPGLAFGGEGMWTFDNLPLQKIQAETGFTPDTQWIKHVMQSSARIEGTCSASFVSRDGLVMTNHHCASECIEQLSSAKQNYLTNGFLASKREQEQVCPDIAVTQLQEIRDVTAQVKQVTDKLEGIPFKQALNRIRAELTSACIGGHKDTVHCEMISLYQGGRYHLYRYHRYHDVRLVWAPEKAIAFFGGDPDNFNFPRYNLDVTMLRAYENGQPAKIGEFFRFASKDVKEDDAVFVTGSPATTRRQITQAQLTTERDVYTMEEMLRVAQLRGAVAEYANSGPEAARTAETLLFDLENLYKQLRGEMDTLLDPTLLKHKQYQEAALRTFVAANPALQAKVGKSWDAIAGAQQTWREIAKPYSLLERSTAFNGLYFRFARLLVRGAEERSKPNGERLPAYLDARLPEIEHELFSNGPVAAELEKVRLRISLTRMRELLGADHEIVKLVLRDQSPAQVAQSLVDGSKMGDAAARKALWQGGKAAIAASDDPFIRLALAVDAASRNLRKRYEREVEAITQKNGELIAEARFAMEGSGVYPDGTFSPRLSFGTVKGWNNGTQEVTPFATIGGAFARHTGNEPFALPASWLKEKNRLNQAQALNFVTTNDIIGGNSGSPMINTAGEIVGLAFDSNIHALGSPFWYDSRSNRAIGVHAGAIIEALEKIHHAHSLLAELRGQ